MHVKELLKLSFCLKYGNMLLETRVSCLQNGHFMTYVNYFNSFFVKTKNLPTHAWLDGLFWPSMDKQHIEVHGSIIDNKFFDLTVICYI